MSHNNLTALNAEHGIPGELTFRIGPGGLVLAEVTNSHGAAAIALQGAHLLSWTRHGEPPLIWLSPTARFAAGKAIRGGIPVCWPWFGAHPTEPGYPSHGFARILPWELTQARPVPEGATHLALRLLQDERARRQWPYASELELRFDLGARLEIALITRNLDSVPILVGEALHTYFQVGDIRQARIQGLDGCPYIDKAAAGKRGRQSGPVTIDAEVDRIYLGSTDDCLIEDPVLRRRIRVAKRNSRSTVVWNPWSEKVGTMSDLGTEGYRNMLCVESANLAEDRVELAPGAEHELRVTCRVEPLG